MSSAPWFKIDVHMQDQLVQGKIVWLKVELLRKERRFLDGI
jgi:hypothetical protein